jgi:DNA-directed RNA polymerase subunit E"
MTQKACKKCRIFTESNECPICHGSNFAESWKGRISITNAEMSEIAKKTGLTKNGTYAIKTR